MSKEIQNIQSTEKEEFDTGINCYLEHSTALMDGGYEVY